MGENPLPDMIDWDNWLAKSPQSFLLAPGTDVEVSL